MTFRECDRPPFAHFRYVSQSSKAVRAEFRAGKASHLTMGEAETALAPPGEFLRKNARQATFHKRAKSARAHREFEETSKFWRQIQIHFIHARS